MLSSFSPSGRNQETNETVGARQGGTSRATTGPWMALRQWIQGGFPVLFGKTWLWLPYLLEISTLGAYLISGPWG